MQDIQAIFHRIEENKAKMKDLKNVLKDALSNNQSYVEASDVAKNATEKKKSIKKEIESGISDVMMKLQDLKIDMDSDLELLSDAAMTMITQGQSVSLSDKYENEYEPVFKVNFKKIT